MSGTFTQDDLIATFLAECEENFVTLEELLVGLEQSAGDDEMIDAVFRAAHTLKGNAATMALDSPTRLAHVLEGVLDRLRERKLTVSRDLVSLLLRATDQLRRMIPEALAGRDVLDAPTVQLIGELEAIGGRVGDAPSLPEAVTAVPESDSAAPRAGLRRIRVDMGKLDRLLNLAGEMIISSGRARAMAETLTDRGERGQMLESLADMEHLFSDLQEQVTRVRMVPIGVAFEQHRRTVRDIAEETGKQVRLIIEGADVEVDASVIEHIKDPLTHMIRNAVDHGIETASERRAAGKDPRGTITLQARHDAGAILIDVSDDGAGLDRARIVDRARQRGLLGATETPADGEIDRLIFLPGFSTAEVVSALSGRGVGMDVVHRNVNALRGTIDVESVFGEGCRLSIRLPLSLAILDGLAIEAGGERFVLAMQSVEECIELPAGLRGEDKVGVMEFRGAPLPFVRLGQFFQLPTTLAARENVVIVRCGREMLGIVADRLLGEMKAVMKPIGQLFRAIPGAMGSTLFGDGRVGLILDAVAVRREVVRRETGRLS